MINCRRPSNRSSRLTLPLGPSNSYFFFTASHGIRRRSAASASRARVNSFSFTSSCWRAASHSCADTILERFISLASVSRSISFSFILFLPGLVGLFLSVKFIQNERGQPSAGSRACGRQRHVCYTYRTHGLRFFLSSPCSFFLNKRLGDRASLPKICDIPLPIPRPAASASLPISIDGHDHSAGVEAAPLSRALANVSKPPAATSHADGPDRSRSDRRGRDGRGFAGGSGRPARQRCDSSLSVNI